jgi:hypothetical protein
MLRFSPDLDELTADFRYAKDIHENSELIKS